MLLEVFLEVKEVQNFHVTPSPSSKATEKNTKGGRMWFLCSHLLFFLLSPTQETLYLYHILRTELKSFYYPSRCLQDSDVDKCDEKGMQGK